MDATQKRILALAGNPDVEVRCAAWLILTQLECDDAKIVKALAAALEDKNPTVRDFGVGYLEKVRPKDGLGLLLPLLDSTDDALRTRATKILSTYGAPAVTAVRKLVQDGPKRRLHAIVELCTTLRSAAALDILFQLMSHEDFDTHRGACDAVISVIPALDAKAKADLAQRAETLLKSAKGHRSATIAASKLLGALAQASARKLLLPLLDREYAHSIRTHALSALVQCLRGETLVAKEVAVLVPLLTEDDEQGILRPAIALLDSQTLDRSYLSQLNRLAEEGQPAVRRFAVHKLGEFDSGGVVKTLIGYLTDDSYARRDQAAASLKKLPAARSALMTAFLASEDERQAWALADVLLAHDRQWKSSAVRSVQQKLDSALESRDDRLYTAYFQFLSTIDSPGTIEHVRERAALLHKKKDYSAALKWLTLLKDTPAFDDETRFSFALTDLKARKHAVIGGIRRNDPSLEQLRNLSRSTFELSDRLRKERTLEPEEIFYVAFNFAEGGADEKSVAEDLLEHLAEKFGRTKVGKAAKNKLKLLGAR